VSFFKGKTFITMPKGSSEERPLKEFLNPKTVAIPLRAKNVDYEGCVSVGDLVKIGTKIGEKAADSISSSISGKVIAIEKRDHTSLKKIDHVVIENDFKEEREPCEYVDTKAITISGGGVKEPSKIKVKLGTQLSDIIEFIGGYTDEVIKNPKDSKLVAGAALTGKPLVTDEIAIESTSSAFLIIPPSNYREMSCMRCSACVIHCPKGLQPVQIAKAHKTKNNALLQKLGAQSCISCGMCSFVCPSFIELTDQTTKAKQLVLKNKGGK